MRYLILFGEDDLGRHFIHELHSALAFLNVLLVSRFRIVVAPLTRLVGTPQPLLPLALQASCYFPYILSGDVLSLVRQQDVGQGFNGGLFGVWWRRDTIQARKVAAMFRYRRPGSLDGRLLGTDIGTSGVGRVGFIGR